MVKKNNTKNKNGGSGASISCPAWHDRSFPGVPHTHAHTSAHSLTHSLMHTHANRSPQPGTVTPSWDVVMYSFFFSLSLSKTKHALQKFPKEGQRCPPLHTSPPTTEHQQQKKEHPSSTASRSWHSPAQQLCHMPGKSTSRSQLSIAATRERASSSRSLNSVFITS